MSTIVHILFIILLVLQIIVLVYMLICQIKRQKEDKNFWKMMDMAVQDQVNRYNELYPNEPIKLEEDKSEQQTRNKK